MNGPLRFLTGFLLPTATPRGDGAAPTPDPDRAAATRCATGEICGTPHPDAHLVDTAAPEVRAPVMQAPPRPPRPEIEQATHCRGLCPGESCWLCQSLADVIGRITALEKQVAELAAQKRRRM